MTPNRITAALLLFLCTLNAAAEQTVVAVAANFAQPMQVIAAEFEQHSGHAVKLSIGSSGKLYAQIQHGAPFHVFLSADAAKPEQLIALGKAVTGSQFTYAVGKLALWHRDNGPAREVLESGDYRRLAIANPRLAPYGLAAVQSLQQLGIDAGDRLVTGENISQAYRFVASGNADLGFVALSQIITGGKIPDGAWLVPASLHAPIRQDAVLLERGQSSAVAHALLKFLQSDTAVAIIRQYGYDVDTR